MYLSVSDEMAAGGGGAVWVVCKIHANAKHVKVDILIVVEYQ